MSSILFSKKESGGPVYISLVGDATRSNYVQPVSQEFLDQLGIKPENIQLVQGKISPTSGYEMTPQFLKQWSKDEASGGAQYGNGPGSLVVKLAQGSVKPADFGVYKDQKVSTPEQRANNAKVAAQMQKQDTDQKKLESDIAAQKTQTEYGNLTPQEYAQTKENLKNSWTISPQGEIIDGDNPLVKQYMAAFPGVNLDAAIGSVANQQQMQAQGQIPATPIQNLQPQTTQQSPSDQLGGVDQGQQNVSQTYDGLPDSIKNSEGWKNLSDDQKALAYFTYQAQNASNAAQKEDALRALDKAMELADPYFKEQIKIAKDELGRSVSSSSASTQEKVNSLQDRIKGLNEDLTFNKQNLTLEEQSALASQKRQNEAELFNLQQQMAESGLAFSSPRQVAEQSMQADQQGINESTRRKFATAQRDLQVQTARDMAASQAAIASAQRTGSEQLTDIQRKGEAYLGSTDAPAVDGVTGLGGVTGSLNEQKQQQIIGLQQTLMKKQDPFGNLFK